MLQHIDQDTAPRPLHVPERLRERALRHQQVDDRVVRRQLPFEEAEPPGVVAGGLRPHALDLGDRAVVGGARLGQAPGGTQDVAERLARRHEAPRNRGALGFGERFARRRFGRGVLSPRRSHGCHADERSHEQLRLRAGPCPRQSCVVGRAGLVDASERELRTADLVVDAGRNAKATVRGQLRERRAEAGERLLPPLLVVQRRPVIEPVEHLVRHVLEARRDVGGLQHAASAELELAQVGVIIPRLPIRWTRRSSADTSVSARSRAAADAR